LWIAAMLAWFAVTVLRGRRQAFAFGTLTTGLATLAVLLAVSPDDVVARANVVRMASVNGPARFDVAYATTLSADAVPALIEALPTLPPDLQCPLARHLLRRWPADRDGSLRNWNWSGSRAASAIREHDSQLRLMVGPSGECAIPPRS
jgi:hypothetical protein